MAILTDINMLNMHVKSRIHRFCIMDRFNHLALTDVLTDPKTLTFFDQTVFDCHFLSESGYSSYSITTCSTDIKLAISSYYEKLMENYFYYRDDEQKIQEIMNTFVQMCFSKFDKKHDKAFKTTEVVVNYILDQFPNTVWLDPDQIWYDPCCGSGEFPVQIYNRLMVSLSSIIIDKEQRRKHILENMIYFGDVSNDMIILTSVRLDPYNTYILNAYVGDTRTRSQEPEDIHRMKNNNVVVKRITVGNPPFTDGTQGKANIYQHFIKLGNHSLYQGWVTQSSWMMSDAKEHNEVRSILFKNGLKHIKILPHKALDADARMISFICEANYTGDITLELEDGTLVKYNFRHLGYIPSVNDTIGANLIKRLIPSTPYVLKRSKTIQPKKDLTAITANENDPFFNKNKWVKTLSQLGNTLKYKYVKDYLDLDSTKPRIVAGYLGTGKPYPVSTYIGVTVPIINCQVPLNYRYYICSSLDHAKCLNKYFDSKLVKYILVATRTSRTLDGPQLKFVPKINLTNPNLTDQDIYDHFKLTTKEIALIERTIND